MKSRSRDGLAAKGLLSVEAARNQLQNGFPFYGVYFLAKCYAWSRFKAFVLLWTFLLDIV